MKLFFIFFLGQIFQKFFSRFVSNERKRCIHIKFPSQSRYHAISSVYLNLRNSCFSPPSRINGLACRDDSWPLTSQLSKRLHCVNFFYHIFFSFFSLPFYGLHYIRIHWLKGRNSLWKNKRVNNILQLFAKNKFLDIFILDLMYQLF